MLLVVSSHIQQILSQSRGYVEFKRSLNENNPVFSRSKGKASLVHRRGWNKLHRASDSRTAAGSGAGLSPPATGLSGTRGKFCWVCWLWLWADAAAAGGCVHKKGAGRAHLHPGVKSPSSGQRPEAHSEHVHGAETHAFSSGRWVPDSVVVPGPAGGDLTVLSTFPLVPPRGPLSLSPADATGPKSAPGCGPQVASALPGSPNSSHFISGLTKHAI